MTGIAEFRVVSSLASSAFGLPRGTTSPHVYALPTPLRMRAHAAGSSYLPVALLMARTAVSMICSSRLLWAPRQYTWPQLWQRENAW